MRNWWGAAAFPTFLIKLLICKSHYISISVPPVASWWFEINLPRSAAQITNSIQVQCLSRFTLSQISFWPSQGVKGLWCAAVPTCHYSDSVLLPGALSLRPTPKMLMSKCKMLIFCIFFSIFMYFLKECREYFLCGLSTMIRVILWVARYIMDIFVKSDGKQTLWLPFTFTVHGDGLPVPFCWLLLKRKCSEDKRFVQYFGLLDMNGAFWYVSTSWVKVFPSGLRKPKVFIVISVHRQLLPKM